MRINVFMGEGNTFDVAAEKAQDDLIKYCQANYISSNDVISMSPTVTKDTFGYEVSL